MLLARIKGMLPDVYPGNATREYGMWAVMIATRNQHAVEFDMRRLNTEFTSMALRLTPQGKNAVQRELEAARRRWMWERPRLLPEAPFDAMSAEMLLAELERQLGIGNSGAPLSVDGSKPKGQD